MTALEILAVLAVSLFAFAGVWLSIGVVHAACWIGRGWVNREQVLRAVLAWPAMMLAGLFDARLGRRVLIIAIVVTVHAGACWLAIEAEHPFVSVLLGVMAAMTAIRLARRAWR